MAERRGFRFHTPPLSETLEAVGLPGNGVGRGASQPQKKLQQETYNNWQWHQEKDSAVRELVEEYRQVEEGFSEPANIFVIQDELEKIKAKLELQLDYQASSNSNLPLVVRAETKGEPLKTLEQLIGEE